MVNSSEHLHNAIGAKTLFATHYHELTELAGRLRALKISTSPFASGSEPNCFSCEKLWKAARTRATASRSRGWLACERSSGTRKTDSWQSGRSELTPEGNVRPQTRQRGKLQNLPVPPQMDLFR